MAISTLAQLETAVSGWLHRADLSADVDNLILMGELWIFRNVRAREMEDSTLSVTLSSGVGAVPSGFVGLKHARLNGSPSVPLTIRPVTWIYSQYPNRSAGGQPKFIGVDGSNFVFGPAAGSYTLNGTYYKRPTSVLSSANTLFTTNPDLYLFAALAEAEAFVKNDKRVGLWIAKRDAIKDDVNREAQGSRFGDALSVSLA
jgi:hypothetical protein